MKQKAYGFTIVELLIVIVVIGILASVTVVAYGGVKTRANNTARYQEVMSWHKLMQSYIAQEGKLPPIADGSYCLGAGFPDGDGVAGGECRDYAANWTTTYHETGNTTLMTELKKIATTVPNGPRTPVNGTVGPYITTYPGSYTITTVFNGNNASECKAPMFYSWSDGNGRLLCQIDYVLP
jgi:prepilin-type N-terminal cleavage/methylation domain-containing protein